ncbi:unnamed protein product [Oreochromis niloticus]|nr:unnamed protein product [Mustela putorius furo]
MEEDKRERGQERKMGESLQSHGQMGQTQVNKEDDNKKTDEELVHLRREIGLLPAVSFIMGTVVGSGIFIAPKGVLINSGSMGLSLLVWGLCGVLSLFAFLVAVNCWSVRMASHIQVSLTFIKIVALVLIIIPGVIALVKGKTENFQNGFEFESLTLDRLPLAIYNGLYAYSGWFYLNFVTEEVKNPNRNIPLAIILSMVTVTVLYVLVNVAYYTILAPTELLLSDAVAVTFATYALRGLDSAIPILVALSCLATLNGGIFVSPRMLFVGAREGYWPQIFSTIHIRRHTPLPALLLMYPLMVIMLISGDISQLMSLLSFSDWFFIALATLGMLIHRYRFPLHPRPFKVPLVIPVTFTVVSFFIVSHSLYSDPWNTGCSCLLTLSGVPVYYMTVYHFCLPPTWRRIFNYCSKQLQILLEVAQQEVKTC